MGKSTAAGKKDGRRALQYDDEEEKEEDYDRREEEDEEEEEDRMYDDPPGGHEEEEEEEEEERYYSDEAGAMDDIVEEEEADPRALNRTTAGKREKIAATKGRNPTTTWKGKGKATTAQATKSTARRANGTTSGVGERKGLAQIFSDEDEESEDGDQVPALEVVKRSIKTPAARSKRGPSAESYIQRQVVERVSSQAQRQLIEDANADGLRRSTRHRFAPLDFWRGEKAVYGRPSLGRSSTGGGRGSGSSVTSPARRKGGPPVPVLKELVRVPRLPGEGTFSGLRAGQQKRSAAGRKRSSESVEPAKRKRAKKEDTEGGAADISTEAFVELDPTADSVNVEDGWDKDTDSYGLVWDTDTGKEVQRRKLAFLHGDDEKLMKSVV